MKRLIALIASAVLVIPLFGAGTYATKTAGLFRGYAIGAIRPDEGTVEVSAVIDKAAAEFGNGWNFFFQVVPSQKIGTGANTLLGIFTPALPETGLAFLLRTGRDYYRVNVKDFVYTPRKRVTLAIRWGKKLTGFIDGKPVGTAVMRESFDEKLLSYVFRVDRFSPCNVRSMKISTRELADSEMTPSSDEFRADADTSFIALNDFADVRELTSTWHRASGYAALLPAWRAETQVFTEGEHTFFPFIGVNYGTRPKTYTIDMTVKDYNGIDVPVKSASITLPADGKHHITEIPLPELAAQNYYFVNAGVSGDASSTFSGAISVVPAADPSKDGALALFYGQHQHWDFSTAPFAKLGTKITRNWTDGNFLWHCIEPERGTYQWARTDAYVKECREAGMEILAVLGYPSRWAAEEPSEEHKKKHPLACRPERWKPLDNAAWGKYIYETVKRYKEVKYWEIYNEVNFSPPGLPATFSGTPEDYFELLKIAYAEAKRANPACTVLISGFSADVNVEMPIQLINMGALNYCDIFNVHGYSGVPGAAAWVAAMKKKKPMPYWMTEHMWHLEENIAKRQFLTVQYFADFLAAGYDRFINMGTHEVFFSRYNYSPTPDFHTTAVFQKSIRMCTRFGGAYTFPGSDSFAVRHHFSRTDGKTLSIIGSELGSFDVRIKGTLAARDIMGQPMTVTDDGGESVVPLKSVAYLVSEKPLTITGVKATSKIALCQNGGFEDIEGDIGMGGLKSGRARNWLFRDKTFDPAGTVMLSDAPNTGKYAYRITSSGKGRVYLFQYMKTFTPGTYNVSAAFKRTAGDPKQYFFYFDMEHNKVINKTFDDVGGDYRKCTWEIELPKLEKLAVGAGILEGDGSILVDDINFEIAQ